jgi:T5SS/PEP-CTERM-associated repeat protein
LTAALSLCALLVPATAHAQANSWTNTLGGKWEIGANWSLGVPPSSAQAAILITNTVTLTFSKTISVDSDTVLSNELNGCMTINSLRISRPGTVGFNTLLLNNAGTATPLHVLSSLIVSNRGIVSVTNSVLRVDGNLINNGTVTLNSGALIVTNLGAQTLIGNLGTGVVTMVDGEWKGGTVSVASDFGLGTATLAGGTSTFESFSVAAGSFSTATVWMIGGALTVTNQALRVGDVGVGQMTVSNGTVRARDIRVGFQLNARGSLTVPGGTTTASSGLTLGNPTCTATGVVFVTGGSLLVTNAAGNATLEVRSGTLTMSGGQAEVDNLVITNACGRFVFNGGTLATRATTAGNGVEFGVGGSGNSATFTMTGGTHSFRNGLAIADPVGATGAVYITGTQLVATNALTELRVGGFGSGQLTVSNGTAQIGRLTVGANAGSEGTLTIAGGTNSVAERLVAGRLQHSTGTVWVTGGQLLATNATLSPAAFIGSNGVGRLTVSNGLFRAAAAFIGWEPGSRGALTVAGGKAEFTGSVIAGFFSNSTASVVVSGGELVSTNGFFGIAGNVSRATAVISGGTWRAQSLLLGSGDGSHGALTVAGGLCTLSGSMSLGEDGPLATGVVWVTGGQLIATNATTAVGDFGIGHMTVSNGTWLARNVHIGNNAGSKGTLTIAGGTNALTGALTVAPIGDSTGTVWLTGGRLVTTNVTTILGNFGIAQMTVSNGTWLAKEVNVANLSNVATLTIAGGTNAFNGFLSIASSAACTGTVWITGGLLVITNSSTMIGNAGLGRMTVSNGTWRVQDVTIAPNPGSAGTLTVAGGTTTASSGLTVGNSACTATGVVAVTGGSLFVTNAAANATLEVRSGTLTQSGGLLRADRIVLTNACARFVRTGGTLIYGSAVLDPDRDDDGDGLRNDWEQMYGLDPLDPSGDNGPDGDADGDGLSNLDEQAAGTIPTIHITAITREGNNIRINWNAWGGNTNALEVTAGGAGGSFTNNFSGIVTNIIPGIGRAVTNHLDTGGATNVPARYYRIRLVP